MMNNAYDENNQLNLSPSDFEFVNKDLGSKIHDEKFKTKPTTFAKDAFKRFCKNKSSVVGAIIIGILLLGSIFGPLISPHDLKTTKADQAKLLPKLFDSGTGWWDGTSYMKNQQVDRLTGEVASDEEDQYFSPYGISEQKSRNEVFNTSIAHGFNGYIYFESNFIYPEGHDLYENNQFYIENSSKDAFAIKDSDNVTAEIVILNEDGYHGYDIFDKYHFDIVYTDDQGDEQLIPINEGYADIQEKFTLNLSEALTNHGVNEIAKAKFRISCEAVTSSHERAKRYTFIKSIKLSSPKESVNDQFKFLNFYDRTVEELQIAYDEFYNRSEKEVKEAKERKEKYTDSVSDANTASLKTVQSRGYWSSLGAVDGYQVDAIIANFRYDSYEGVYGRRTMKIGQSLMQEYINKGYCEFENWVVDLSLADDMKFSIEKYPFRILNEKKCPVVSIEKAEYNSKSKVWQFTCTAVYYKYLGMSSMPKFIFGTDSQGFDILVRCLNSLKTSLLVAIIVTAICLFIGIVWGAVSGYFGGTVDLVMERITDIIGGLPSIVLMTLIMVLMGRTILMFAFSVILTGWLGIAGTTRTQFYRFRDREYVLASRTLGASDPRLIFKHILPNGLGTIITASVLRVPAFIASEATLAYLGIGLKSVDSFGVVLSTNQKYLSTYPMLIVLPAIIISLLMISFNLFGNGLRDAVNPTLKGGE